MSENRRDFTLEERVEHLIVAYQDKCQRAAELQAELDKARKLMNDGFGFTTGYPPRENRGSPEETDIRLAPIVTGNSPGGDACAQRKMDKLKEALEGKTVEEILAAFEDSRRLDWIEKHAVDVRESHGEWWLSGCSFSTEDTKRMTVRKAIDLGIEKPS